MDEAREELKIKGAAVIGVVSYLRDRGSEARALLPEALHLYLERELLVSSWFPEADYAHLLTAFRELRHLGDSALQALVADRAREDLETIYRAAVQKGSPTATVLRFSGLWRLYHDTGSVEVWFQEESCADVVLKDFPLITVDLCAVTAGYFQASLELAGAAPRVQTTELDPERSTCAWRVSW